MFDQILTMVGEGGYAGIAAAVFAENVFPPIPSEIIMPLAGFHAASGSLSLGMLISDPRRRRSRLAQSVVGSPA